MTDNIDDHIPYEEAANEHDADLFTIMIVHSSGSEQHKNAEYWTIDNEQTLHVEYAEDEHETPVEYELGNVTSVEPQDSVLNE